MVLDTHNAVRYVPFSDLDEQKLTQVFPGAVLWEVESLEDNASGSRQHCWRYIFEDEP
jgi:hypothetical protein